MTAGPARSTSLPTHTRAITIAGSSTRRPTPLRPCSPTRTRRGSHAPAAGTRHGRTRLRAWSIVGHRQPHRGSLRACGEGDGDRHAEGQRDHGACAAIAVATISREVVVVGKISTLLAERPSVLTTNSPARVSWDPKVVAAARDAALSCAQVGFPDGRHDRHVLSHGAKLEPPPAEPSRLQRHSRKPDRRVQVTAPAADHDTPADAPRAHPQTESLHHDGDDADRPSAATLLTPISQHQRKTYPSHHRPSRTSPRARPNCGIPGCCARTMWPPTTGRIQSALAGSSRISQASKSMPLPARGGASPFRLKAEERCPAAQSGVRLVQPAVGDRAVLMSAGGESRPSCAP